MYDYNSIKSYMIRAPFLFTIAHDNSEKRDITAQHIVDILTENKYVKNGVIRRASVYDLESMTAHNMKLNIKCFFKADYTNVIILDDIGHFFDYSSPSTYISLMLDEMRSVAQDHVGVILLDTQENMNKLFSAVNIASVVPESNIIDQDTCEQDSKHDYMSRQAKYKNSKATLGTLINAWTSSAQKSQKQAGQAIKRSQYLCDEFSNLQSKSSKLLDNGLQDLIDKLSK